MYDRVAAHVTAQHGAALDALLVKPPGSAVTGFNQKQAPGPATPKTVKLWTDRLQWLDGLINPDPLLDGVAYTKLRQFVLLRRLARLKKRFEMDSKRDLLIGRVLPFIPYTLYPYVKLSFVRFLSISSNREGVFIK